MKFRSKNLLVTGGSGFIGSNFIDFLLKKHKSLNVFNLDKLTYAGNIQNTDSFKNNPRYNFIEGDICDNILVSKIFKNHEIDGVINFAAETHVDTSIESPEIFIKSNINGVFNLLNCAYKAWMNGPFDIREKFNKARFHQISTDEVYGSIIKGSFTEMSKYNPNSPYSASKASADMLVRSFNKTFGLNTSISLSSNNFGKNQHPEKFLPKVIKSLLENREIVVYGDGSNIRDWIHVDDNCSAIEVVFSNSKSGSVYNISSKNELTNLDLIDKVHKIISSIKKRDKCIKFINDRFGHDKRYSVCNKKLIKDFNWVVKNSLELNLQNYIKKFINQ